EGEGRPDHPARTPRTHRSHAGRFFRDLERISGDLILLRGMLEDFRENRDRRPIFPEDADSRSKERWAEYYREQAMREDPLLAVVEMEGLSTKSLEKGMRLQIESGEALERHFEDEIKRHKLEASRDDAFDPEDPVRFLELAEIPEPEEEDDDTRCDAPCCKDDFRSGWSASVPELAAWEDAESERDVDTDRFENGREYNYRKDPVHKMLDPFLHELMTVTRELDDEARGGKGEGPSGRSGERGRRKKCQSAGSDQSAPSDASDQSTPSDRPEQPEKSARMRTPVVDYVLLLVMKACARLSSCGVNAEMVDDEAPIHGCHMFAMDNMEKIAKALDQFGPDRLRPFSARATRIASSIRRLLKG
ncbi:MAG: hypothetical protein RDV41_01055, partial [Planctomycetota bacterium]|nr:hypothetical protein [Planctomycetota bacterium]